MVNLIKFRYAIFFHRVMSNRTFPIGSLGELNSAYETYHKRVFYFVEKRAYAIGILI